MAHDRIRQTLPQQQGFTVIELVIVLTVVVSLMSLGVRCMTQNAERDVNQATAQQLKQVASATHHYVQDHYSDFKTGGSITFQDLVSQGYLAQRVQESNLYGQNYEIEVTPTANQQLQVTLTTVGGQVIAEHSLRQIANLVGGDGGYTSILQPGKIIGSQGAWEISGVSLAAGHLASVMMIDEKDLILVNASDSLRRTKTAGSPEYNKMETDLQMSKDSKLFFEDSAGFQLSRSKLISNTFSLDGGYSPRIDMSDRSNKLFLNPDMIQFKSGDNYKWESYTNSSGFHVSDKQKKASAYFEADKLFMFDEKHQVEMTSKSLHLKDKSSKAYIEVTPDFLRLPSHSPGSGYSGSAIDFARAEICSQTSNLDSMGRLFLVEGSGRDTATYFIMCINQGARVIATLPWTE